MTAFNTGNPIGSTNPKDLYDNAQNLDVLVNSNTEVSHADRLGVQRKTWHGMEAEFDADQTQRSSEFAQFLADSAYQDLGVYGAGIEVTRYNQVFLKDGEFYRASASLVLPYTTTGVWVSESASFVAVGDAVLRQDLATLGGSALVEFDGGTARDVLDNAKSMTNYTALRAYTGRATGVRITQQGLAGFFQRDDSDTASADNGGTIIVDGSGRRWKRLYSGAINVQWFYAKGDWNGTTGADDTAAVIAAHAAGDAVDYPPGRYKVTMPNNAALVTFTSRSGIRILGKDATIIDTHVYTGDPIAPVFDFVGCSDVEVAVNYEGATLASPTTQLGYLGGTLVRWRNGSDNLRIDAEVKNARYGVVSGNYSDTSQGGNKNIKANLRTRMCGYPVALYDVDGVQIEISADGVHRAAYLAGVQNGYVTARWKDQYIADLAVICSDALVDGPGLKGCSNLKIASYDMGSTVFQPSSACCGLNPSRTAYPVTHSNLRFEFGVKSTDTVSTKVAGFKLGGGVGALPSGDPYSWEQTTVLENITVSGVVDRSGQTLDGNTAGDLYWRSFDTGTHYATVRNVVFDTVTIAPSSGSTRNCYFLCPGLQDVVTFNNFITSGAVGLQLAYAQTSRAVFNSSAFPAFVQEGTVGAIELNNTSVASVPAGLLAAGSPVNASRMNGAGMTLRYRETTLTMSGASVTWANAIPLGAVVMGCVARVLTDITGATGYLLGIAADTSRWANTNSITAGSFTTPNNYGAAALAPQVYQASTSIVVTAKTSNFTGGTMKVGLFYFDTTGPTA